MSRQVFSSIQDLEKWLSENEQRLTATAALVERMIESALNDDGIQHLPLEKRIKTRESAKQKFISKGAKANYELTDLIGLRVVVLLDHDIDRAADAVKSLFQIDTENCTDKRLHDRIDSVGYRSLHIVGALGETRRELPEYKELYYFKFEIQIRTALQHTWAEIEHKRNYKGRFALPIDLQRRLMVLSGTLELIDREFSQIALAAEEYRHRLEGKDSSINDDTLSYLAISQILHQIVNYQIPSTTIIFKTESHDTIKAELEKFGVKNLGELRSILSTKTAKELIEHTVEDGEIHAVGLLRDIMICEDVEQYFGNSFGNSFSIMEVKDIDYLQRISGRPDIANIIRSHGVDIVEF